MKYKQHCLNSSEIQLTIVETKTKSITDTALNKKGHAYR